MIKKFVAIILFIVVVCTIAGCTSSPTNQTPSPSTATHDAFLEEFLATVKNLQYMASNQTIKAWDLSWINSTSARVQASVLASNQTWARDMTYMTFPTTQDATNYLNTFNKTDYSLASTVYPSDGPYQTLKGHPPQIYKVYTRYEGNVYNISEYKYHEIAQVDNIIVVTTAKRL